MFSSEKLRELLSLPLYFYDEIDSTNLQGKRLLEEGKETPFLVASKTQTNGRGRHGKSFHSSNEGLYFSLVYNIKEASETIVSITTATSVFVSDSIYEVTGIDTKIKWVNDIFLSGKKLSGILTEIVFRESPYVIVGIGINVGNGKYPDELKDIVTSLPDNTKKELLISTIVNKMLSYINNPKDLSYMRSYREKSLVLGKSITYQKDGELKSGLVKEILDNGALIVETKTGRDLINSGEISIKLKP